MIRPDAKLTEILESYFDVEISSNDSLLHELQTEYLAGGEWLFKQGDPGDSFYFLIRGRLQVWFESTDEGDGNQSRLLGEVVPGDTVGEISLLTGEQRTAGVRAIRDSTLVKVSREAFDHLAEQHPRLVMRLAGSVASVLHRRTSKAPDASRSLGTIAVLPIDDSPRASEFCEQLSDALGEYGQTLCVSPDDLRRHRAPVSRLEAEDEVPNALIDWLHDQEDENRFVVYRCSADATPWSRYAVRQSDIVLFVADALGKPTPGAWESELTPEHSGSIAKRMLVLMQPDSATSIKNTAAWLAPRHIDFHVHVRADRSDDISRVARMVSGRALGLVLSAGAARGIAQLGIFRALVESGITVDWVGGASIGAIMGAGIVANDWDCETTIGKFRIGFVGTRPFSDYTLPLMSLISGYRSERMLNRYLDYQIEDLPTPFFCVSSKLDDGSLNVHQSGPLAAALRASSSMPGIFPPAIVDRRLTIDGAVLNNMPVDIMKKQLVGKVIAVDLSSRKTYTLDYDSMPSPWAVLRGRMLPFARRYRVPSLMTTILKATEIGMLERMRELGKQADLLLHPPVRKFGMTDIKSFDKIMEAGYKHAMEELSAWLERENQD